MKKICILILFTGYLSVMNAQEQKVFTFVKTTILKLEKNTAYSNDDVETKKRMQGMYLIDSINSPVDYKYIKYIKFSAIPVGEKFVMVTDGEYSSYSKEKNFIIQNIKSKQLYAVMAYTIRDFQDYSNMGNEANGSGWLTKIIPKEPAIAEKALLAKYKGLIKSANANIAVLLSIQKRYITRGYFDSGRVSAVDRKTYNKNISDLKITADKLSDIDYYEDKDGKAQDKLTIPEIGSLSNIKTWSLNQVKI